MNEEENNGLLRKYLSMALPYDVIISHKEYDVDATTYHINSMPRSTYNRIILDYDERDGCGSVSGVKFMNDMDKPYLRPISSMTEEEKEELLSILVGDENKGLFRVLENGTIESIDDEEQSVKHFSFRWIDFSCESVFLYIDWMLKNHFDFMGLIPKNLAVAVTDNNNPYKE